jgi:hypothetical protein
MTKFEAMGTRARVGWILWCGEHDWGQGPHAATWWDSETGELVTYAGEHDGFTWSVVEARHKSPAELKAWAGY